MTAPTLHQVAQHAEDLGRATDFYRHLGLRHLGTVDPPGLVFFDLGGGTRLLLERSAPATLLYLLVDDLDAAWRRALDAGAEPVAEAHLIHTHNGTLGPAGRAEWMAFVRDTEGNLVALAALREG